MFRCILAPQTVCAFPAPGTAPSLETWSPSSAVHTQHCPLFLHPPVAKLLSLLTSPRPLHPFCTLQPDWGFKTQVGSQHAPVLKPSSAFALLLEHKANSVPCCRQDSACCPTPFLGHFPSSRPLPQPHFLPGFSSEPSPFPLPGMFFPQPSAYRFLLNFTSSEWPFLTVSLL